MVYIVLITSNHCDPFIKGTYNDYGKALEQLNEHKSTWSDRDYYKYNDYIISIDKNGKNSIHEMFKRSN